MIFFGLGVNGSFRSVSSSRLERRFRWPTCYPHMLEQCLMTCSSRKRNERTQSTGRVQIN